MSKIKIAVAAVLLCSATGSAGADEQYNIVETKDGTFRVDSKSGAVSFCKLKGNNLICRAAADERAALVEENRKLQARIDELEKGGEGLLSKKQEQDIDKAMRVAQNVMRRFITMMKDIQRDNSTN